MFQLAIVADDLTGAMDTGVQFAKRGLRTVVSLSGTIDEEAARGADIAVLNTNSRPDDAKVAGRKVLECGRYVRDLGVGRVYKKVDSTLRGNIGPELDALMDAWEVGTVLMTPAFPAVGRTVERGDLLVGGVPWERTQYAEGAVVVGSAVGRIIRTRRRVANVFAAEVARGEDHVARRLSELAAEGVGVVVGDVATSADLGVLARGAVQAGLDRILCGSGGLAEELPGALGLVGTPARGTGVGLENRPVLVVAGTVNRVTLDQVVVARDRLDTVLVEVSPGALRENPRREAERVAEACRRLASEGRDLIVVSVPVGAGPEATMVARDSAVATAFGPLVAAALRPGDWAGIVMTGGDTAVSLCSALGVSALEIEGEVEPGVPCGRLLTGPLSGTMVVTKAGGFGTPEAIAKAITFIRGKNR